MGVIALTSAAFAVPVQVQETTTCTEFGPAATVYEGEEYAPAHYDGGALKEWAGGYEAPAPAPVYEAPADTEYSYGGDEHAAAPAPAPAPNYGDTSGTATDDFSKSCLEAHNVNRAKHRDTPPVSWSPSLAAGAQEWANACNGMEHGSTGENLYASTDARDPSAGIQTWYDEISQYSYGAGGFDYSTGHFTQVVWKSTTQIGCGINQCPGMFGGSSGYLLVCRYQEAGNMQGAFDSNVMPTY